MLSTSAGRDGNHPHANLYMWGHYAQGHRGLALEFDTRALARAALQVHEAENGKPSDDQNVWAKVEYSERFEPISAEHVFEFMKQEMKLDRRKKAAREVTQIDRYYNRMSIIKSDVWQNENEWRLMWRSTEDRKVYYCPIGKDAVTGVLLGMGLPDEKASDITRAVRSNFPDTPIFRARKRHGDFALEFHQI